MKIEEMHEWFKDDLEYFQKTGAKIVKKPWGAEVWLELNEHYCYKRIYLTQNYQTSLQHHKEKIETNYIIDGQAEVWMQDSNGETFLNVDGFNYRFSVTKKGKNAFFTVIPPTIHRVKALTNIILQEVSTPQVDDVIRHQDDTGRGSGRIQSEHAN